MPQFKTYADATALIGLGRINRLDLLTVLTTPILVTAWVWDEIAGDAGKPGIAPLLQAREAGLLLVVEEGDPHAFPQLDPGEASVLTAASAARAIVMIDERKARSLIGADPRLRATIRSTIGVVGLILLAKRRGRIPAVRPLLDDLLRERFWISPALYGDALQQAGEQ